MVPVLNDKTIQPETAETYIESLRNVEIEDVAQVDSPAYRDSLLTAQLVQCNANNIILFYQEAKNSITDELAQLINAKGTPTDLNADKCQKAGVDETDTVGAIIKCRTISPKNKETILRGCRFRFSSFGIDRIDDETTATMVKTKTIEMNGDMLDKFRSCKPNLVLSYILSDLDSFLALIGTNTGNESGKTIEKDEVMSLLKSNIQHRSHCQRYQFWMKSTL